MFFVNYYSLDLFLYARCSYIIYVYPSACAISQQLGETKRSPFTPWNIWNSITSWAQTRKLMCVHSSVLKTLSITFSKHTDPSDFIEDLVSYLPDCELDVSVME